MKKTLLAHRNSMWVNPTDKTVKLDLCVHACAQPDGQDARAVILIPPFGTAMSETDAQNGGHVLDDDGKLQYTVLPAELDRAIHQTDENGKIVGGMAPQLRRFRSSEPDIEPSLQPERHALEQARKVERERQMEASEAEQKRLLAQANARAAEEAKSKADAVKAKEEAETAKAAAEKAQAELAELKAKLAKAEAEKNVAINAAADANKLLAEATAPAPKDAPKGDSGNGGDSGGGGKAGKGGSGK